MKRSRSITASFIVAVAVLFLVRRSTAAEEEIACTDEDYSIFSAALTDLYGTNWTLVLLNRTSTGHPPGLGASVDVGGKQTRAMLEAVPKEAREDYDRRNKLHAPIKADHFRIGSPLVLLSPEEAIKLIDGGGWAPFKRKYPYAQGVTILSLPGISARRDAAVLYVGQSCGGLCGEGFLVRLAKDGNRWRVVAKETVWVS